MAETTHQRMRRIHSVLDALELGRSLQAPGRDAEEQLDYLAEELGLLANFLREGEHPGEPVHFLTPAKLQILWHLLDNFIWAETENPDLAQALALNPSRS